MVGICGDNCSFCPRYVASQNGSVEAIEKVKKMWVRLGLRKPDFPLQAMTCNGCLPENKCAYSELRSCVNSKGVENCGLCSQYPCETIEAVFANSERLRSQASLVCTGVEMELLDKAFFSKSEYFDLIQKNKAKCKE